MTDTAACHYNLERPNRIFGLQLVGWGSRPVKVKVKFEPLFVKVCDYKLLSELMKHVQRHIRCDNGSDT
jgi:hypothetical protein